MATGYPPFRPRAPWWGPDLQTLRNMLRGPVREGPDGDRERVRLPLADGSGDVLAALLHRPPGETARPLVVLIHGLSGSEDSAYMSSSSSYWVARGHPVLRLNLRGAGASRETCRLQYHAGRSEDLRDALRALKPELTREGLLLVGYSLGANMLLKFLAEYGAEFPIRVAGAVSAPIDLSAASRRFLARRNVIYHRHLLGVMKSECFGGRAEVSEAERRAVLAARSIFEFDDNFVAPRNGFRNAEHYYRENHARRFLCDITTPTLLIHSLDDPWIPSESYTQYPWDANPNLQLLLSARGGHLGFHDRTDRAPWYDRCIGNFYDRRQQAA